MRKLSKLEPQPLFNYFEDICQVPRPSQKEEKIRQFLLNFAEKNGLATKTDETGNVLISKPAVRGRENTPTVILQTHMDIVCEKNSDKVFDFDKDPIEPVINGKWIRANGTTLGADCGIGIAAQMAVLTSNKINHGPVECLITVGEETGLTGAFGLRPEFMKGTILLNLDSEDEGEIFIGCAGGIDTLAIFNYTIEELPDKFIAIQLSVSGLKGGHSGDDIHKNRGNANKILNRILWKTAQKYHMRLSRFDGGNLRNAIAREAKATIVIPENEEKNFRSDFRKLVSGLKFEYEKNEPYLQLKASNISLPDFVIDINTQTNLINALFGCPHGVIAMSTRMEGMVETSTNLASVKFEGNAKIIITTSQRSELESRKYYAAEMVNSVFTLAGAEVIHTDGYPGWTPNPDSAILKTTVKSYKKLFNVEPVVCSIHAGLECGLFLEKYPYLDMVSFGPTIYGAHSPDERLNIKSTEKFWKHLVDILESIN
jgi:dipeptidase D